MNRTIATAEDAAAIARCFPVMRELRPHLVEAQFVDRVLQQYRQGFQLVYLEESGAVFSVVGFRVVDNLIWGRFMYVDDFVTAAAARQRGCGDVLFAWLIRRARQLGCGRLELDSGFTRHEAHRFYLRHGMVLNCHHFSLSLGHGA